MQKTSSGRKHFLVKKGSRHFKQMGSKGYFFTLYMFFPLQLILITAIKFLAIFCSCGFFAIYCLDRFLSDLLVLKNEINR